MGRARAYGGGQIAVMGLRRQFPIQPDGTFKLEGIPEGEAIFVLQSESSQVRTIARVDYDPDHPAAIEFSTESAVSISGAIVADEFQVTGAQITISSADPGRPIAG